MKDLLKLIVLYTLLLIALTVFAATSYSIVRFLWNVIVHGGICG